MSCPLAQAQDDEYVQVGVFADYLRLDQTSTNFAGVGARAGFQLYKELKLKGEMSYNFNQTFTEGFTDTGTGTVTFARTEPPDAPRRVRAEVEHRTSRDSAVYVCEGRLYEFQDRRSTGDVGTFISSVSNLRSDDVSPVLYPGGGLQGQLGPIGLRLDVGDEIYFNSGSHHNLRIALGPVFRF